MTDNITAHLWVRGTPIPQGSKSATRAGRMYEANKKTGPWRKHVAAAVTAWRAKAQHQTYEVPVAVQLIFVFPRPKYHWRTGRNEHLLRDNAPRDHGTKPDVDKLARAIFDALTTAQMWTDDSLVCNARIVKRYPHIDGSEEPGVYITVWPADRPG